MLLKPREYFPISRQLYDPLDATTYYIRATIRDENKNVLIDTVDLADKGSQLFVYRWQVPADVSGEGFWLSITTRVYTDAGYTALSQNHEQNLQSYLVSEVLRSSLRLGGGGGSGADVDYKKVAAIFLESLRAFFLGSKDKAKEFELSVPESLASVLDICRGMYQSVKQFGVELSNSREAETEDVVRIHAHLDGVETRLAQRLGVSETAEPGEPVDLGPMQDAVQKLTSTIHTAAELLNVAAGLPEEMKDGIARANAYLPKLESEIRYFTALLEKQPDEEPVMPAPPSEKFAKFLKKIPE